MLEATTAAMASKTRRLLQADTMPLAHAPRYAKLFSDLRRLVVIQRIAYDDRAESCTTAQDLGSFEVGQRVRARVLAVDAGAKTVALSLLRHLVAFSSDCHLPQVRAAER
jgi:hypothetical protein